MLRNTKNGKWEMHTVGSEIWQGTLKKEKLKMHTVGLEFMARNTQKRGKLKMHTLGPGI